MAQLHIYLLVHLIILLLRKFYKLTSNFENFEWSPILMMRISSASEIVGHWKHWMCTCSRWWMNILKSELFNLIAPLSSNVLSRVLEASKFKYTSNVKFPAALKNCVKIYFKWIYICHYEEHFEWRRKLWRVLLKAK